MINGVKKDLLDYKCSNPLLPTVHTQRQQLSKPASHEQNGYFPLRVSALVSCKTYKCSSKVVQKRC